MGMTLIDFFHNQHNCHFAHFLTVVLKGHMNIGTTQLQELMAQIQGTCFMLELYIHCGYVEQLTWVVGLIQSSTSPSHKFLK